MAKEANNEMTAKKLEKERLEVEREIREKGLQDKKILLQVKEITDPENYERIVGDIEDEGCYHNFKIVDKPKGIFDEDYNRWVNQTTNGGFTGDSFAGTVSYKISNTQYLQASYSM